MILCFVLLGSIWLCVFCSLPYVFPLPDSAGSCSHAIGLLVRVGGGAGRAAVPRPEVLSRLRRLTEELSLLVYMLAML